MTLDDFEMATLFVVALSPGFGINASTNGLPGDVVYCIYQDHNGTLWLGTDTGLNRCQGYSSPLTGR
jgi:ligand-binding sensor domain-containing protein